MDCIVLPVSILKRRYWIARRLGYVPLVEDGYYSESDDPITFVVGKQKREFEVDPLVLEEIPFRVLIDMVRKENKGRVHRNGGKRVVFVDDVDAILFEHMLWLLQNDCSSLFQLNLREMIEFYSQDN